MKKLVVLALLCCLGMPAAAAPASVWWPGWNVESGEELSAGLKYAHKHDTPLYPLSRLFDGDPATAWVYSATNGTKGLFGSRHLLKLLPERPVAIDGLCLMNGQNQSRSRFLRNDRITRIRVSVETASGTVKREFALADTMGWHSVKFPRCTAKSVTIEFTGITRGTGPGNDICISELALLSGAAKVDMHMPRAVMYYDGLEGCGASYLILKNGESLDGIGIEMGDTDQWSADGRYVCGQNLSGGGEGEGYLWIADAWRGKVVKKLPGYWPGCKWTGPSTLRVTSDGEGKGRGKTEWVRL